MIVHGNINLNTFNAIYSIYRWVRNERKNVRLCYVVGYFASLGPLREKLCCKSLQSCWVFFRPLSPSCICYIIDFSQIDYSPSFNILCCLLDNNTISWSHYTFTSQDMAQKKTNKLHNRKNYYICRTFGIDLNCVPLTWVRRRASDPCEDLDCSESSSRSYQCTLGLSTSCSESP